MPLHDQVLDRAAAFDRLREAGTRLSVLGRAELAEALGPAIDRLHEKLPDAEAGPVVEAALALCRRLYANARSGDALPLARAVLAQAALANDPILEGRAATACGALAADTADIVGAVEYHVRALRIATARGNRLEMSRGWNNLGAAMGIAANYEMAARCYQRAIDVVKNEPGPVVSRYASFINIADACLQVGSIEQGLDYAWRAVREQAPAFREQDPHGALLLQKNIVRLLAAAGRVEEALPHVSEAAALAELLQTPRAQIAAATARAVYELGTGHTDVALTRFEQAVSRAREVPAALRDTLSCAIQAEEAAGHTERALLRMRELSDHVYRAAIARAREHVEIDALAGRGDGALEHLQEQARARLVSKIHPPQQPEGWEALERLAVTATMRIDRTGWHGRRVGTLSKALARASGMDALNALELGLAAQLHDIGMLSVPEALLARRGELSEPERALVARHVDAADEILCDDRHARVFLAREIARYHHARWDGTGYPERVGGRFIPFAARVCAVADAYDSRVNGLYGLEPVTMDKALDELKRGAGTQFDPELVARFDALVREESEDLGMDLGSNARLASFQELVGALEEDRGFV